MADDNYFDKYDTPSQGAQVTPTESPAPTNSNYFDKYDSGVTAAPQQGSAGRQSSGDDGAFMAGVENFNRVFANIAEGTIDLVARATGSQTLQTNIKNVHDNLQASADLASQRHPLASGVGTVAGILATAALPLGGAGAGASLGSRALTSAGGGALAGFLNYAPTMDQRLMNGSIGGVIGGALPLAGGGYMSAAEQLGLATSENAAVKPGAGLLTQMFRPSKAAKANVAAEVGNAGGIEQALANKAKFDSLGIPSTLADATQSPGIIANLEKTSMNISKRGEAQQTLTAQQAATRDVLNKELEQFVPGGVQVNKELRNKLYDNLSTQSVPDDVLTQLKTDPSIASRFKAVNDNPDLKLSDVPDNNLNKIDAVRKELASDIWSNTKSLKDGQKTTISPQEATNLKTSLSSFTTAIDQLVPEYAPVRQLGDRVHSYELFKNAINPAFKDGTNNTVTLKQVYSNLFGTPQKQEFFLDAVKRSGGNPENSKNLMDVLNLTNNSVLNKLVAAPDGAGAKVIGDSSGTVGMIQHFIDKMTKSRYQSALLKLNLSPKWQEPLTAALGKPTIKETIKSVGSLMDVVAQANDDVNKVVMHGKANIKTNISNLALPGLSANIAGSGLIQQAQQSQP